MDFSKMNRNDKIDLCLEFLEDKEFITDKLHSSASGVSQERAYIKLNMKRNKTLIFNSMLDALSLAICDRHNSAVKNLKLKKEKDEQIEKLEFRISELESRTKTLETTIKEKDERIELLESEREWYKSGFNKMKKKFEEQEKIIKSLQEQINKLSKQ